MSARSSNLELPTADELREMIQKESPRLAARRDFLDVHAGVFKALRAFANETRIDCRILDDWKTVSFDETVERGTVLVNELEQHLVDERVWSIAGQLYAPLNFRVSPVKSDVIFVFGSSINKRVDAAVELYRAGVAPKIMTTGHGPHWGVNRLSEGRTQAEYAIASGVPQEDIIVEERSIATPDNVKRSVDMWLAMNWRPTRVTIVTSEFHLMRAYMDMYKFPDWGMQIFTAAPDPSEELNVVNWIKTETGRRIVLNEYAKLIMESKIDQVLAEDKL